MTKSILLGFTLALVAGFCTFTTIIVREIQALAAYRLAFVWAWALVAGGLFLWPLVAHRRKKAAEAGAVAAQSEPGTEEEGTLPSGPLRSMRYWAGVTALFAVISFFIQPWEKPPKIVRATAPPVPQRTNEPPPPPPQTSAPVVRVQVDPFAKVRTMRLQGMTLNDKKSTVILNGHTYMLGEEVDGAKITLIHAGGIVLDKDGEVLQLLLKN